jgi:hypothetical protein
MRWLPATCLVLALALVGDADAAAPVRVDLKDPFTRADRPPVLPPERSSVAPPILPPDPAASMAELHDPFAARRAVDRAPRRDVEPDLRNPFAADPRARAAASDDETGLKNPFLRTASPPAPPRRVTDGEPTASDLKNPFARRDPPTRPRSPAVATPLRPLRAPATGRQLVPLQRPRHVRPAR